MADIVVETSRTEEAKRGRITAEEYFAAYPESMLPMELIDGEVMMSPAPLHQHQQIVLKLAYVMMQQVLQGALGEVAIAPNDVYLDEDNVVQPDVFFVGKDNQHCIVGEDGHWHGAPDLCIEVISSSSEKRDRVKKFDLYAAHGVREYWIVDTEGQFIEVYTLKDSKFDRFGAFENGQTFASTVLPQVSIALDDIFPPDKPST